MNLLSFFDKVKLLLLDVDGVLTNGQVLIDSSGNLLRSMNIKDGFALQLAIKKGYKVAVISGGSSDGVVSRLQNLGITEVRMGVSDKVAEMQSICNQYGITPEDCLFVGDDIPDKPAMQLCGFPCCPADAVAEIKDISTYISPYKGGEGCVRDVIEKWLRFHGDWDNSPQVSSK